MHASRVKNHKISFLLYLFIRHFFKYDSFIFFNSYFICLQVLKSAHFFTTWRKPVKAPSSRAIENYNNISTSDDDNIYYKFVDDADDNSIGKTLPRNMPLRVTALTNHDSDKQENKMTNEMVTMGNDLTNNGIPVRVPSPDYHVDDINTESRLSTMSTEFERSATPDSERTNRISQMGSSHVFIQSEHREVSFYANYLDLWTEAD